MHVCVVMPTASSMRSWSSRDPKNSKVGGGDGLVKIVLKKIAPAAVDKAPPSPGAVEEPLVEGKGVSGGRGEGKSPLKNR